MQIKIKDADSFRCAVNSTSNKDFSAVYRYVRLGPTGALTGTNGYFAAHNKNGVEPFDHPHDVFIIPEKNVPLWAENIVVDTDARLIHFSDDKGKAGVVMIRDVSSDGVMQYPDVERVIPSHRQAGKTEGPFSINIKYLEQITKGINFRKGTNNHIRIERSGDSAAPMIVYHPDADPDLVLLLVPLRVEDGEERLKPINGAKAA